MKMKRLARWRGGENVGELFTAHGVVVDFISAATRWASAKRGQTGRVDVGDEGKRATVTKKKERICAFGLG